MTLFRPCIDLHQGRVKQIVGGTLTDSGTTLQTNFESPHPAAYYAEMYRQDHLTGGHIIMLGPGNEAAARSALAAYPNGLQIGGGITPTNAVPWLAAGASHLIVTSYLFSPAGKFLPQNLAALTDLIGKEKLIIDLSCRRTAEKTWTICMNRWQTLTDLTLTPATLETLSNSCAEFLIHAADVEGQCNGMDEPLLTHLAQHSPLPTTYAGGARSLADLALANHLTGGRIHLTIGSALDLFGGTGITYADCLAWNRRQTETPEAPGPK